MQEMKTLHEVCDAIGVTRRAVQGYEKRGLVVPSGKNKYGYLLYDYRAQQRIALIKRYQRLGFKLKDIEELIDAPVYVVSEALKRQIIRLKEDSKEREEIINMAQKWIDDMNHMT